MFGEKGVKLTMLITSQVNASSKKEGEDWFETVLNIHTPPLLPITPIFYLPLFNSVAKKFVRKKTYWGGGNLFPQHRPVFATLVENEI
jgi:hypothetical protein